MKENKKIPEIFIKPLKMTGLICLGLLLVYVYFYFMGEFEFLK